MYPPPFPPALTHMTAAMGGMGGMPPMGTHISSASSAEYSHQASLESEKMRAAFLPSSLASSLGALQSHAFYNSMTAASHHPTPTPTPPESAHSPATSSTPSATTIATPVAKHPIITQTSITTSQEESKSPPTPTSVSAASYLPSTPFSALYTTPTSMAGFPPGHPLFYGAQYPTIGAQPTQDLRRPLSVLFS
ncbi:UNVERIFIED_CONTAM: hypothetical protein RMT77_008468 [Armadillidium vulgare]